MFTNRVAHAEDHARRVNGEDCCAENEHVAYNGNHSRQTQSHFSAKPEKFIFGVFSQKTIERVRPTGCPSRGPPCAKRQYRGALFCPVIYLFIILFVSFVYISHAMPGGRRGGVKRLEQKRDEEDEEQHFALHPAKRN